MRKTWCVAIGAIAVAGAVLAPATAWAAPAETGPSVDTTTTFSVTSGALTITAPDTANLGSGAPGTTISGSLGAVTVTDDRAALDASWTATASSTDFTTGGGTPAEIIPVADVSYIVGDVTVSATGTTPTVTDLTPMTVLAQPVVVGGGVGDNTATWTPTIDVAVPGTAVTGTYTGTITHSVA
jgi:hypothetical protein